MSAEQGDANAQFNLGFIYEKGQGVTQDYAEAVKWYRMSAEQGFAALSEKIKPVSATSKSVDIKPQVDATPPRRQIDCV